MAWLGLRHKGVEVLYPDEWNKVVDGLDILKQYTDACLRKEELLHLDSDIIPAQDSVYNLGEINRKWKDIYAYYGFFVDNLLVQGKPVLKDGDPVITKEFIESAKEDIEKIYNIGVESKREIEEVYLVASETKAKVEEVYSLLSETKSKVEEIYQIVAPAENIETWLLNVSTTPIPLSEVDMVVKRIHVKVPSWAFYLVYIGNASKQEFVLEKGDKEVFEVKNPKNIYVRSLGNVTIYVMVEK